MKNIKVYRESGDGNYLVTLAVGNKYLERWENLSLPFWKIYTEKNNLGLIAIVKAYEDKGEKRVDWQKLICGMPLRDNKIEAKRICFIDYDIVPNPYSENIFSETKPESIGIVSQRKNMPYREINDVLRNMAFHRNYYSDSNYPLDSYLTAEPEDVFKANGFEGLKDYACGGLFIFDHNRHTDYLIDIYNRYHKDNINPQNPGEEVHLNYHIQNHDDCRFIPYKWQTLWCYEMSTKYSWLYKRDERGEMNVSRAVLNSLGNTNFLHFVGSWEKWAWEYVDMLKSKQSLKYLEEITNYKKKDLTSKMKGFKFPSNTTENMYISK